MECIQVWSEKGLFDYLPDAQEEFWEDVIYDCDDFFHVQNLKDLGKYTDCYRVEVGGKTKFYFVVMPQW